MANVKLFTDNQMDAQTNGRAKNYMPPIYRCGGIKNIVEEWEIGHLQAIAKINTIYAKLYHAWV